ncbi:MAG: zinc ribbon domain-containing protein [Thermodesulfobacteriota bacterium]|nr:MAG: zinc ribbon domain-containing protein [Thermodesulfobacteriota bacterium]
MPIYEFFCPDCNTVFNFYSPAVNTHKIPRCPQCQRREMKRLLSNFATISVKKEPGENEDIPLGEAKMMEAVQMMEKEMKNVEEDDHRQVVSILRKLSKTLGVKVNDRVEEAMLKIEAGADPEEVASEITEDLDPESFFEGKKPTGNQGKKIRYNETLYEL